jgi:hypothetical protein
MTSQYQDSVAEPTLRYFGGLQRNSSIDVDD